MGPCPPTHVQGSRPGQQSQICVRTLASNRARSDTPSLVSGHALAGGGRWDQRPVADPTTVQTSSLLPIEVALVGQQVQDGGPDTWISLRTVDVSQPDLDLSVVAVDHDGVTVLNLDDFAIKGLCGGGECEEDEEVHVFSLA